MTHLQRRREQAAQCLTRRRAYYPPADTWLGHHRAGGVLSPRDPHLPRQRWTMLKGLVSVALFNTPCMSTTSLTVTP